MYIVKLLKRLIFPVDSVRCAVIVFPGSNCDHDAYHVLKHELGQDVSFVWHKDEHVGDVDFVLIPGGFSYGDALRSGAIARFSPIMKDVIRFANSGGLVMGICNGFQVLCESGLLPGALTRNASLKFVCKNIHVKAESVDSAFSCNLNSGDVLTIPIAHGEGNYIADEETLDMLQRDDRVIFRYCADDGVVDSISNPNGSARNIAGIVNAERNVLGMMPHPERCSDAILGGTDGIAIFRSLLSYSLQNHTGIAEAVPTH
jgi:phosphoribosylformylglycinamidine synthase subunit PurQ / glutaminase